MLDTLEILEELKKTFEPSQAEVLTRFLARLYKELADTVTKGEFIELTKVVQELSRNVKTLSERVDRLAEVVEGLEKRVSSLEVRVGELEKVARELVEAHKSAEGRLTRLEVAVERLQEAQRVTEERVRELTEAQRRTDEKIKELTEAQRRTEREIQRLTRSLEETREQLGGLSDTVGYTLENAAFRALPKLLRRDYGLIVKGRLKRGYLKDIKGRAVEVNIIGEGTKNGKKYTIIGEGKVRLSKRAINEFIKKRVINFQGIFKDIFPVLVTHMISEPDAEEYAREKGIALYYSYDFE
jgi:type I site-specific restriction endonuclease